MKNLAYPFAEKINDLVPFIDTKIQEWMQEYSFLPQAASKKLQESEFGRLTALFFPHADKEVLIPSGRLMLWVFIFDDIYGALPEAELAAAHQRLTALLDNAPLNAADNEIYVHFATALKELKPYVNDDWMVRFKADWLLFFEGQMLDKQYSYGEEVIYPSISSYLVLRDKIGGAYPFMDISEITARFIMPRAVFEHPAIQQARYYTSKLTTFSNDLLSYEKELRNKEAMNLVAVIRNEWNCSLEDAYQAALNMHNEALDEYLQLRADWPDFGEYSQAVERYILDLELMINGHLAWYHNNERYK